MKKYASYITLTVFNKILFSYLITIFIPTVLISSFYFFNYSEDVKEEIRKTAALDIANLTSQVHTMMDNVEGMSLQLSLTTNLNQLLAGSNPPGIYDLSVLNETIQNKISTGSIIKSVYIYFKINDRVLVTNQGYYRREEFSDRDWLDKAISSKEHEYKYEIREIPVLFERQEGEVISLRQKLPLAGNNELGHMIVNVSKDSFFQALMLMLDEEGSGYYITDANASGRMLFAGGNEGLSGDVSAFLEGEERKKGTALATLGESKYFISFEQSPVNGWTFVRTTPYREYLDQMKKKFIQIGGMSLFVMAVGFLLSYIFAMAYYRPWKKLMVSYGSFFVNAIQTAKEDAYTVVRNGLDHLINENRKVRTIMESHEPMVKDRLLYDLLNQNVAESTVSLLQLKEFGIDLTTPYAAVCIVESDMQKVAQSPDAGKIKLYIFGLAENLLQEVCPAYGLFLDEGRFGFVMKVGEVEGHKEWKQKMIEVCEKVNDYIFEQFQLHVQFSFGKICSSPDFLHESYAMARKGMKYKSLFKKSDVVFMDETTRERGLEYPLSIQKMLVGGVKATDTEKVEKAVTELFSQFVHNDKYPYGQIQEMILILLSAVASELLQDGYDSDVIKEIKILEIHDCRNNSELEQLIRESFRSMIRRLEGQQDKKNHSLYIGKAIAFMESRYNQPISISQIAEHAGISSSYLSRVFKAETGISPLDYLTKYRITLGKEMLLDPRRYSLQEISAMVGYADVHSFIRSFKKYEAVTPGEYRKWMAQSDSEEA